MDPRERHAELRRVLADANHAYYVLYAPTLSDDEYRAARTASRFVSESVQRLVSLITGGR